MVERLIFLHGWGVHHTKSYGWLPERVAAAMPGIDVARVDLGQYVSFRDEVRMGDLVRAMEAAIRREAAGGGGRIAVIAHSTGGAVARCWWQEFHAGSDRECPVSHMIGLAPAHFGSALAQLGKGRLNRLARHFDGVDPGVSVLDWLELGSPEAWQAGVDWIGRRGHCEGEAPVFHFSLTGQRIDRKLYDGLNPYTGEMGSDGTVRVASANLNSAHLRLVQRPPTDRQLASGRASVLGIDGASAGASERVPFALVPGASHTGTRMGIMSGVRKSGPAPAVVGLIRRCLEVEDAGGYRALADEFAAGNELVVDDERAEVVDRLLFDERVFAHDICSMAVVRVRDSEGRVPARFRIEFLGENGDPNRLPKGFLVDRQRNRLDPGVVTFFFNHDRILGCRPVRYRDPDNGRTKVFRRRLPALSELGIRVEADPSEGFAHYHPCVAKASGDLLARFIRPHQTVLVDIVLQRIVREGAMRLSPLAERGEMAGTEGDFRDAWPGPAIH